MVFILTQTEHNYRDNYVHFERSDGLYFDTNYSRNKLIDNLATLFTEQGPSATWILRKLLDPKSRGIQGSLTEISIDKNRVFIGPSDIMKSEIEDDPEDAPIEIDRDVLIRLTTDWQELVQKGVPEIFIYQKDGEYFVADTLPEGVV